MVVCGALITPLRLRGALREGGDVASLCSTSGEGCANAVAGKPDAWRGDVPGMVRRGRPAGTPAGCTGWGAAAPGAAFLAAGACHLLASLVDSQDAGALTLWAQAGRWLGLALLAAGLTALWANRRTAWRRQADPAPWQNAAALRAVFDAAPVGIVLLDRQGRVLEANAAYARMAGRTPEDLRRQADVFSLYHADERDALRAHFSAVTEDSADSLAPACEWRLVRPDLSELPVRHLVTGVGDANGHDARGVAIVEDVSAARRIEERLRHDHTMEVVGLLAAGVAHDFNNLLQVILGYTGDAIEGLPEHDPCQRSLRRVAEAGQRAAWLTSDLLAFSRRQVFQPADVDLREVLRDAAEAIGRVAGPPITVEVLAGEEPCPVRADPAQIEQAILNLCLNARDAMPSGGRLSLTTAVTVLPEDSCADHGCVRRGRYAALRVTDTGIGMDEATLDRLFEPCFSARHNGPGLAMGLAAAFNIASQHGGTITAVSTPGKGSTFTILIPLSPQPQPRA